MIDRYTRPEMGKLWSQESRFQCMMEVEISVAQAQAEQGMIPKQAAEDIAKRGAFQIDRILEIEKETKHDVIAFVSNLAENVGENGRFIHYGLTSSDVLDTALSLQCQRAGELLLGTMDHLLEALQAQAKNQSQTICAGRTHGMHAEPTTFGYKLAGFYAEFARHKMRLARALEQLAIGKLSGAVGTYSFLKPELEARVCEMLNLKPETIATQVIPRDRHGELFCALALLAGGLERIAIELRHLQRNEMSEVSEGFSPGQKGSSAMPHKKNPISSENLTGCARLMRSNAVAALENIALWHERDISHSAVERVIFPDGFILADYSCHRLAGVIANLVVDKDQMKKNMDISQGQLFSSHLLLHVVDQGQSREQAYKKIQSVSHLLEAGEHLKEKLLTASETKEFFTSEVLEEIFSGSRHLSEIDKLMTKVWQDGL